MCRIAQPPLISFVYTDESQYVLQGILAKWPHDNQPVIYNLIVIIRCSVCLLLKTILDII